MELIPWYSIEENIIYDGDFLPTPKWCKKNYCKKCEKFYKSIVGKEGYYTCPYGFTAYSRKIGTTSIIYTCAIVQNWYNAKLVKPKISNDKNRFIYSEEEFETLITKTIKYNDKTYELYAEVDRNKKAIARIKDELEDHKQLTSNTLHEVRSLNKTLKSQSEDILHTTSKYVIRDDSDYFGFRIRNINATTNLLTVRLQSYDILSDPHHANIYPEKYISIHNKFFKTKQLLSTFFHENRIDFDFTGNSYSEVIGNDLVELLPYLVYENYIKYSLPNERITTEFSESFSDILVRIYGYGPKIESDEISHIFEKGYRSKNAILSTVPGSGIGLHLCKMICDLFDYKIEVSSSDKIYKTIENIPYSKFEIRFEFRITNKRHSF